MDAQRIRTVVIGAGQAGLAVGYHLAREGQEFVILNAHARVGDSWRQRWDSLRLFTAAKFDGIPGMAFPAPPDDFPTKDQMADYLEHYARHFDLPVRNGVRVEAVTRDGARYRVVTSEGVYDAANVVVAMANFQHPRTPAFAASLDPSIVQIHSSAYRNPSQLQRGGVLVVGAGNSGAELAKEFANAGHRVWIAGPDVGQIPFSMASLLGRLVLGRLVLRVVFHRILTIRTPIGRRARPKVLGGYTPLIRVKRGELQRLGVEQVSRVTGVRDGRPQLDDGRVLDATNVVWSTGFEPGFSWLQLPVFDARGAVQQHDGVAVGEPGLFFVGLHFLRAMSSAMVHGVGRDAEHVARLIAERPVESALDESKPRGAVVAAA